MNHFPLFLYLFIFFIFYFVPFHLVLYCIVEYRIPYRIGPRTIITHAHRAPLIDGLGYVTWSAT